MPPTSSLWALLPETAETVLAGLMVRPQTDGSRKAGPPVPDAAQAGEGYDFVNGVAVISVNGPIYRTAIYFGDYKYAHGQDEIARALDNALADSSVQAILLSLDSPGGIVAGTKELADKIAVAAQMKPLAAYADGLMASAAMWLGAAAGRVYAPQTARVGSIGVISTLTDYSKANEKMGITVTYITGGKFKSAGYPSQPLNGEARALFQREVDELHEIFKADVKRGLGITAPDEQWAEGQTMLAGEARQMGLVTAIVRDLATAINLLSQETVMDYQTFAAKHPDLLAEITAKAKAEALEAQKAQASDTDSRKAAQEAGLTARAQTLSMVSAVAGAETAEKVESLLAAGIMPEQLELMAGVLGVSVAGAQSAPAQGSPDGHDFKAKMLAAMQSAAARPVEGAAPPAAAGESRLVADAKRRAAAFKI